MSPADARRRAVEELRRLRYGPESKDYFWINDMHPYLIMHPYRPDLEGKDISDFSDPNGKKLFVEFVNTVKNGGTGLGLAIADRIVEDHGGLMRFTSTVNQRTTARVCLPITGPISTDQRESS